MNFEKMTFTEKFGQMIMLGLDVYDINDEIIELIENDKIGGIVLYKKNYISIDTMIKFINKLKKYNSKNIPLFIAIDQENGLVNRFPKDIVPILSASKQAKCENDKIIKYVNELTTYILSSVGVNMNMAPVLDIRSKALGSRSYGINKEDVIKYGLPLMKCSQENNIISVVKHFPGHGATNIDSHIRIPYIKNIDKLQKEDLVPFEAAIKNGADAIMVGHMKLKGYGRLSAITNKRIIKEMLIDGLNYRGLIVTDDLRMGYQKFLGNFRLKSKIIKAINAGNDVILIKYKKKDTRRLYKKLYKMVDNYELNMERIEESSKKIVELKNKYQLSNEKIKNEVDIDLVNEKIKFINDKIEKKVGVL